MSETELVNGPEAMNETPENAGRPRERLDKERVALARWQSKMKRAFHAVTKSQKTIARIERQLNQLEE